VEPEVFETLAVHRSDYRSVDGGAVILGPADRACDFPQKSVSLLGTGDFVESLTGQVRPAQIFIAVMGASNFTYAEASWRRHWLTGIGAHTRAFAALGGVPKLAGAG
jgi:hypothetical protein